MPALATLKPEWRPSGLVETFEQLQEKKAERRRGQGKKTSSNLTWCKERQLSRQSKGEEGLALSAALKRREKTRSGPVWYAVPNPPPLAGLTAGETLCAKCHDWLVRNKRRRVRREAGQEEARSKSAAEQTGEEEAPKQLAFLENLGRRADLNGQMVRVITGPDERGNFLVTLDIPGCLEGTGTLRVDSKNLSLSPLQGIQGGPASGQPES